MSTQTELERINEKLFYDPEIGFLHWKRNKKRSGFVGAAGYRRISYKADDGSNKTMKEHRYVWQLHNGLIDDATLIDHINRDRADN